MHYPLSFVNNNFMVLIKDHCNSLWLWIITLDFYSTTHSIQDFLYICVLENYAHVFVFEETEHLELTEHAFGGN